jgi:hypothetical protein
MKGTLNQIYSVQGTDFSTIESIRAIVRAKEIAHKTKQLATVLLNNQPQFLIDGKGKMIAA